MMQIKEYRKTAGLTQKEFSELFTPPIPIDTVKKWDAGKMQPPDWVEGLIIEKLGRIKKMEITEKLLLDNYIGITNGFHNISDIDGKRIFWNYRRGKNGDGYNPVRSRREDASEISLEDGVMIEFDNECKNHAALEKIYRSLREAGVLE